MKQHEIKVIVNGAVKEVIKRPIHQGCVCVHGKWYEVKDGSIEFTEAQKEYDAQKERALSGMMRRPYQGYDGFPKGYVPGQTLSPYGNAALLLATGLMGLAHQQET